MLATAGAAGALLLLVFYSRLARESRSRFTLGLVIFSLVFFVQNVTAALVYFGLASSYSAQVALPLMALHSMELVGMAVMVWMARQ
jgi:hypothetical protein